MHVTAKAFPSGSDRQPVIDLSRTISVAIGVCPLCGILGRSGTRADQHLVDAFPVHVDNLNPEPVPFEGIRHGGDATHSGENETAQGLISVALFPRQVLELKYFFELVDA